MTDAAPSLLSLQALAARRAQRVAQRDQLLAQANAAAGAIAELDALIAALNEGSDAPESAASL